MGAENRIGVFKIDRGQVRRNWAELLPLMGNMVVVEARSDWVTDSIEYTAYCQLFDPVTPGAAMPEYTFIVNENVVPAEIRAVRLPP